MRILKVRWSCFYSFETWETLSFNNVVTKCSKNRKLNRIELILLIWLNLFELVLYLQITHQILISKCAILDHRFATLNAHRNYNRQSTDYTRQVSVAATAAAAAVYYARIQKLIISQLQIAVHQRPSIDTISQPHVTPQTIVQTQRYTHIYIYMYIRRFCITRCWGFPLARVHTYIARIYYLHIYIDVERGCK